VRSYNRGTLLCPDFPPRSSAPKATQGAQLRQNVLADGGLVNPAKRRAEEYGSLTQSIDPSSPRSLMDFVFLSRVRVAPAFAHLLRPQETLARRTGGSTLPHRTRPTGCDAIWGQASIGINVQIYR